MEAVEFSDDEFPQSSRDVRGDLDAAVVVLDGGFEVGNVYGLAFAADALGVPAGADEVWVDHAASALRVGQDEARPAFAAVDAAFEVAVVSLGLLPGSPVRGEHRPNPVAA